MYVCIYVSLFTELLHAITFYWETENKQVKQSRWEVLQRKMKAD